MTRVITIGRQFGSGGHDIGEKIAKALDYDFYDKELVEIAAKQSDLAPDTVKHIDERATSSLLYSLASGSYSIKGGIGPLYYEMPLNDKLFIAQSDVIKQVAHKGNCVIVGRCSDYVLENEEDIELINVFIYASNEFRIERISRLHDLSPKKAKDRITKTDKQRRTYYGYYTNRNWGEMDNYDICINSSKIGEDAGAKLIVDYIKSLDE